MPAGSEEETALEYRPEGYGRAASHALRGTDPELVYWARRAASRRLMGRMGFLMLRKSGGSMDPACPAAPPREERS